MILTLERQFTNQVFKEIIDEGVKVKDFDITLQKLGRYMNVTVARKSFVEAYKTAVKQNEILPVEDLQKIDTDSIQEAAEKYCDEKYREDYNRALWLLICIYNKENK